MQDPRLTKLDQQRLIAERDEYRRRLADLEEKFSTFKKEHKYCGPVDLDGLVDLDSLE